MSLFRPALSHPTGAEPAQYNGLDRVDNALGYTPTNVVACCGLCNWIKRDLSQAQFLAAVARIYHHSIDGLQRRPPADPGR